MCNVRWLSVNGCELDERGKSALSYRLEVSPLQHYRVTVCDVMLYTFMHKSPTKFNGLVDAVVQLVEYRTRNREVAGSTHTRSTASNLEQVANLLRAQSNSDSYPQRDGK